MPRYNTCHPEHNCTHWLIGQKLSSLLLLLICLSTIVKAQNESSRNFPDTSEVSTLIKEGRKISGNDPERSIAYFQKAMEISNQLHYYKGLTRSMIEAGNRYMGMNIDEAIKHGTTALKIYTANGLSEPATMADIYLLLAESYDEKGKIDSSAYYYYLLSEEMENHQLPPKFEIDLCIKLIVFWIKMDYDSTIIRQTAGQYMQKARTAAKRINEPQSAKASLYFVQGVYYLGLGEYDSSRAYFMQNLTITNSQSGLPRHLATLVNIGETYLGQNNPKEALKYFQKAIDAIIPLQPTRSLTFYLSVSNFLKARALYDMKNYGETVDLINATFKKIDSAKAPMQTEAIDAHKLIADAYQHLGQYQKAWEHAAIYIQLHDSLMQRNKLDMINRLEIRYRLSEKNKELTKQKVSTLEAENNVRKKNLWLINTSFIIVFLILIFLVWSRNNLNKQKLQLEKIANFQKQMEIEKLHAAITGEERERNRIARELHDGIGSLLTAAKLSLEMIRKNETLKDTEDLYNGIKLVEEASVELRKTAHNMRPEILLQEGLVEALRQFCHSMSKNSKTSLNLQVLGIPVNYSAAFELAVYRIIQELLHNILKHANASEAIVQISFSDSFLSITVEDNGVGMDEKESTMDGEGMGIASIRERIEPFLGSMTINSSNQEGTSVYIEFDNPAQNT